MNHEINKVNPANPNLKRISVGVCQVCGIEKFRCYNDQGVNYITKCKCEDEKMREDWSKKATEKAYKDILKQRKDFSGLSKKDIREVNQTKLIKTQGNRHAIESINSFVNNFSSETERGYMIIGPIGCGKSIIAKKAEKNIMHNGYTALFIDTNLFLEKVKERKFDDPSAQDIQQQAIECDLLILDNFGLETYSDWNTQTLFSILEKRWGELKPTIYTSSLTQSDLRNRYGKNGHFYSRLLDSIEDILTITGPDMRMENFNQRRKKKI